MCYCCCFFFVFKQKTAYEMRISDWSSDVCSSDLDKLFYCVIGIVTAVAVGLNFLGFKPMKALVWSGIVQGFSVPPLLLLMMLLTNSRKVVGTQTNGRWTNLLGWGTTFVTFLCTVCLVVTWFL